MQDSSRGHPLISQHGVTLDNSKGPLKPPLPHLVNPLRRKRRRRSKKCVIDTFAPISVTSFANVCRLAFVEGLEEGQDTHMTPRVPAIPWGVLKSQIYKADRIGNQNFKTFLV